MDQDKVTVPVESKIEVPLDIAVHLKLTEFDKLIAEAEAQVYELKKQKAAFLYEQNVATIRKSYTKSV